MDNCKLEEIFRCKNCDYILNEPHESECCGDLYCHSCAIELKFNICRECRKMLKFRPNLFAKKLLNQIELKCRDQCGGKFSYEDMKSHLFRCENRIFKCTIEFCSFVGKKKDLAEHMKKDHQMHLISLLENYSEFKEIIQKIIQNPINKKPTMVNLFTYQRFDEDDAFNYLMESQNESANRDVIRGYNSIRNRPINRQDSSHHEYESQDNERDLSVRSVRLQMSNDSLSNNQVNDVDSYFSIRPRPEVNIVNRESNLSVNSINNNNNELI